MYYRRSLKNRQQNLKCDFYLRELDETTQSSQLVLRLSILTRIKETTFRDNTICWRKRRGGGGKFEDKNKRRSSSGMGQRIFKILSHMRYICFTIQNSGESRRPRSIAVRPDTHGFGFTVNTLKAHAVVPLPPDCGEQELKTNGKTATWLIRF